MPYSITTKDGITINNIPDDVPPDSPELKARVAAIRAGGGAAALEAPKPQAQAPAAPQTQNLGILESIGEMITGSRRATPESQALPEWTGMPELNQMSVASFKTALGTLLSNPQETVNILKANFPDVGVRQDAKGNFILKSSVDQKEYVIPPGFSLGDIPRAIGGLVAFTPAGRAATIPGAIGGAAATQAAIEATQAGTGGEFNPAEVAVAGALGPAGQIVQRAAPAIQRGVRAVTGRAAAAPAAVPPPQVSIVRPPAEELAQRMQAQAARAEAAGTAQQMSAQAAAPTAGAAAPLVAAATETEGAIDVLNLARKAQGFGPGSSAAKAKLADMAQVNPEARAAAERLGVDLPVDVFSDSPQVRAAVGLTRAKVGGEAEAAWEATVRQFMQKADEISQQSDAAFIEGRPAPGMTSQRILDNLKQTQSELQAQAKSIYDRVDNAVPKTASVEFPKLTQTLDEILSEVGEKGFTAQEKKLYDLATDPNVTYGRLLREKDLIGQAMAGKESPYGNMAAGSLKRLYGAIAEDQLTNVGAIGGEALRTELRAANLLTAKKKALEKRIVGAFGKEIDGSVAQKMQTAIATASKGDAAAFNKLMKVVPADLRKETIATALASVTAGKATGRAIGAAETVFSPSEYTKVYRGLRANPPVYAQMVKIMGPEWDRTARDLYEVSRRVADAQARIPTTGKANQILGEAAVDGLIGNVMANSIAQSATTGAVSLVPVVGGLAAPSIVKFMESAKGSGVQKASKLFASPEFQELAVKAATTAGQPSKQVIRRAAMSAAFSEFANAVKMPKSLDYRIAWLQNAMQATAQATEPQMQP